MMNWADKRLDVTQIKNHPWFYGADWNSLRYIEPPFVPRLNSITDTSYFPTDELGNVTNQLDVVESVGAEKDLAFLGYVSFLFFPPAPHDGWRAARARHARTWMDAWQPRKPIRVLSASTAYHHNLTDTPFVCFFSCRFTFKRFTGGAQASG